MAISSRYAEAESDRCIRRRGTALFPLAGYYTPSCMMTIRHRNEAVYVNVAEFMAL
ncbi:MAG TPA: hypothetical protein VMV93_02245 [Chloroflexota bacterium]|nr:hypothetical protein [Chloroflexota bacterium]